MAAGAATDSNGPPKEMPGIELGPRLIVECPSRTWNHKRNRDWDDLYADVGPDRATALNPAYAAWSAYR